MTGCERCNTVNTAKRHVYIVLFKGDDSDFAWNQNIEITLETEMDLTGFRAKFSFMDFTQEFADITSKKLVLVFPATATSSFPLGAADASIVLYDSDGKARTIANRIHMIVTKCVDEAYANEDPQAITVSISSSREQADWDETDTQSPSYIRNKPKIPSIDATLTQSGEAADAKTVGAALRSGFTPWKVDTFPPEFTFVSCVWDTGDSCWKCTLVGSGQTYVVDMIGAQDALSITDGHEITLVRRLITPTKTSQLENDGAPNGGGTPYATTGQIPSASMATPQMDGVGATGSSGAWARGDHVHPSDTGKMDSASTYQAWNASRAVYLDGEVVSWHGKLWKANGDILDQVGPPDGDGAAYWDETTLDALKQDALTDAQLAAVNSGATAAKVQTWDGYATQISLKANTSDVNAALAQKASLSDLPYRLVEPGKWTITPSTYNGEPLTLEWREFVDGEYAWVLSTIYGNEIFGYDENSLALEGTYLGEVDVTATRASLPGHLCDRAGNLVVVSGDTVLTLPAADPGYLRDFLVRLEISGSTVPTITFSPDGNESVTYETDGDDFPVPDEAGDWLYSFTESCVAHKFAVSLKKVNEVAQGGS